MDISTPAISPLRQRMLDDMRMRKFEPKTQSGYLRAVHKLAAFLNASPDTASAEDLRRFQIECEQSNRWLDRHDRRWLADVGGLSDPTYLGGKGTPLDHKKQLKREQTCVGMNHSTHRR